MENLRKAFEFGGVLNAEEIAQVTDPFVAQSLRAGEHFFAPGDYPNRLGFVSAGVCRLYLVGRMPEEEATRCFIRPHQFILDLESLHSHRPTQVGIQALTACELLDKRIWQQLLVEVPKLFILSKLLTEVARPGKNTRSSSSATPTWSCRCRNTTSPPISALRLSP
ncbi:Crp/Fnr family transcriptional regulator [Hymenobacter cellulosilyticus]|uniref:Crp/Fnr family transcriptional regulator n=1 Tax=Hymenobacter cellulosilyticus TaxID=2932248 RepID=UPI00288003C1|nr:hypothetical protein [Hymenobacter cellulosilyticus]